MIASDLAPLSTFDMTAVLLMLGAWVISGRLVEHPPKSRLSVSVLMQAYRREWMHHFVTRQPRMFDGVLINSLRQATAFLVSTSMIAIGGCVAMIRNAPQLEDLTHNLALIEGTQMIEVKLILTVGFLANALLKFIWAHRLFGYCEILMASVPNDVHDPIAYHRAGQAGEVNVQAAKQFNRGLRSIYFALGSLGWILGPWALIIATVLTTLTLLRREFASVSRRVILDKPKV